MNKFIAGGLLVIFVAMALVIGVQRITIKEFEYELDEQATEAVRQETRANAMEAHAGLITEELEHDYQQKVARLKLKHGAVVHGLLDANASLVPPVPGAAGSGDESNPIACFDRGVLNAELTGSVRQLGERLDRVASEGEGASAVATVCVAWAVKQRALAARVGGSAGSATAPERAPDAPSR